MVLKGISERMVKWQYTESENTMNSNAINTSGRCVYFYTKQKNSKGFRNKLALTIRLRTKPSYTTEVSIKIAS